MGVPMQLFTALGFFIGMSILFGLALLVGGFLLNAGGPFLLGMVIGAILGFHTGRNYRGR